jgi:hypothetical protein
MMLKDGLRHKTLSGPLSTKAHFKKLIFFPLNKNASIKNVREFL